MPLYKWLGPGQELDQDGQKYKPNDDIEMTEDTMTFMRKIGFLFEEVKPEESEEVNPEESEAATSQDSASNGEAADTFEMTPGGAKPEQPKVGRPARSSSH